MRVGRFTISTALINNQFQLVKDLLAECVLLSTYATLDGLRLNCKAISEHFDDVPDGVGSQPVPHYEWEASLLPDGSYEFTAKRFELVEVSNADR